MARTSLQASTRDNLSLLPLNALVLTDQEFTLHVLLEIAAADEVCTNASFSTDWS